MKALDVAYFWLRKAAFECLKRKLPRRVWGMLPQEIFKKEHPEMSFPAFLETKYQFPRQGQMVDDGGGGMATTEFSVVYWCEFIFY